MGGNIRQWFRGRDMAKPFISLWRTTSTSAGSSATNQIKLPLVLAGVYDFLVDWGDTNSDTITVWNQAETTHTYASTGDYTVTITGVCEGFRFANTADRLKIRGISQWGSLRLGNANGYFYGCTNLNVTATDILDLTGSTDLSSMFRSCTSLVYNSSINNWDTSSVTSMNAMFQSTTNFNQPLNNWNVSSVTNFGSAGGSLGMFLGATNFNQPLNNWNTSSAQSMASMFLNTAFNQNISGWDVSNVTNMDSMFRGSPFNQNIGSWNVGSVINMNSMFQSNTAFNQNIGSWNTSSVTSMASMFLSATGFNQPIGGWNVSGVASMASMFSSASAFNQDIGNWTLNAGVNLASMFNVANLTIGAALQEGYSRTLIGWANQIFASGTPLTRSLGASNRRYNATAYISGSTFNDAIAARAFLVTSGTPPTGAGWTISGDASI